MNEELFNQFLSGHHEDLLRISRATRGEASPEEVKAEAWLMIADLRSKGIGIDLDQAEHRQMILARLYQHLVRYTELNVRYALRLDRSPGGEEGEAHPLSRLLTADESSDPVVMLMRVQDEVNADDQAMLNPHQSLASAYLRLLQHLDNRMTAMAEHLLISLSYCYKRCSHARILAIHQKNLPAAAVTSDRAFIPGAWRRFRLERQPEQLSLDFVWNDALFMEGA